MWSKEQIANWKQGKFKSAERKDYLAWRKAGKPEFQEPKPQADPEAPQQGPQPYDYEEHGPGSQEGGSIFNFGGSTNEQPVVEEEAPAELAPVETGAEDIMSFDPATATSETVGSTFDDDPDDTNIVEQWAYDAFDWAEGTEFGDFIINDVISYIDQGLAQRAVAGETAELLLGNYSSEDVEEYIAAVERMNAQEQTEEQNAFNAEIEANGGGFWGTIKAAYHNPSATTGIMITSMIAMTTGEALAGGAAVAGTVTAGASVGGPIGTVLGAIGGSAAGLGTVSAITDATLTFNDYMQTQLRESGKEFNQENIQALLNDPEKIKGLRAAAAARGIAIGVIDALTFKLGSAIAKPLTTTLGRGAGALTGTVVEGIGGAAGEAAGQGAEIVAGTREEFDTTEITLEGIAEVGGPGTVLHVAQAGVDVKNTVVPTADTKPSADLSTLTPPTVEAVNEVEATGIITEEQTPEAAAVDIKRVAVKEVNAGLEAEGVTIENATPEQIEAVIPRIQEKIVNTLKENGIIKQDVDINAPEVTALIKRVAVDTVAEVEAEGVQTEDVAPEAEDTVAPEYTPEVETVNETEAAGVETEDVAPQAEETAAPQYTPTVETVNEIETSGIVNEGVEIEAAIPEIQRIAVRSVLAGIEAQGIVKEEVTIETIEENIPRIGVDTVSELQAQGIISPDVKPETVVPIIQRIAVDTVNEIKAQAVVQEEVNIAHRDVTAEINAPRLTQEVASEIEATGVVDINTPAVQAAIETIPNIVIEEIKGDGATTVESVVEKTVNAITEKGVITEDQPIEVIEPVIRRIAQHTVNELTPGGVEVTPLPEIITEVLNAEAVNPAGTQVTIGPNNDPISDQEVETFVENATDEELVEANIQVNNDPVFAEWIADKVVRAGISIAYAPIGLTVENKDRIVDLEVGLTRYEDNDTTVGKAIKTEINRRIKNIAMGKPEMDGIITEATEGKPAQNNSILGDESFAPIKKPIKQKAEKKVKPSIEYEKGTSRFDHRLKSRRPTVQNENYIGETQDVITKKGKRQRAKNYDGNRKNQINRITEDIQANIPTGNQFYVVNGGTDPQTFNITKKIARKNGLEVIQHPLNPGEYLVHKRGADMGLRGINYKQEGYRTGDWIPFGASNAVQFFAERVGKNSNSGIREGALREWVKAHKEGIDKSGGLLQDLHTLDEHDKSIIEKVLEEEGYAFDRIEIVQERSGYRQVTEFLEFYDKSQLNASIKEAESQNQANIDYLNRALKLLKSKFPKVKVVSTMKAYREAYIRLTAEGVRISPDSKGFVYEGKVYLNPTLITKDTPFHEFAHLWINAIRVQNPPLWEKMKELLKDSEFAEIVGEIPYYKGLDEDSFMEEVAANALGKRAAVQFENNEQASAWKKFIQEILDWIKYKLNISSQSGINDLTLEDILDAGSKAILAGDTSVFYQLNPEGKIGAESKFEGATPSLPEGYPDNIIEIDLKNASVAINRTIKYGGAAKVRKSTDPEVMALLKEETIKSAARRLKVEESTTTKKPVEAIAPAMSNPTFKKIVGWFEDYKANNKTSIWRTNGALITEVSNERLARTLGKIFQNFEPDTNVQQFYSAAGKRALPRKPEGMTNDEFKQNQLGIGALMLQVMIDNGALDLNFHFGKYQAEKKDALKKATKSQLAAGNVIPADAGYIVEVKDQLFINDLADAVAIHAPSKPDFKEVYVGDQKPEKVDGFRSKEGLQVIARDNEINQVTRETHPEVFKVKDAADGTKYVIDKGYLKYLKEFAKLGVLTKDGTEESKLAQQGTLETTILNLDRIGDQSFSSAHNFVHNGRLMNTSTDVSHQSSKNILAAYSFEQQDPMGESGWEWTRVLTTDTWGYSGFGDTKADRLKAFETHKDVWMEIAADPMSTTKMVNHPVHGQLSHQKYILKADVPMLFLRHILEVKAAIDSGDPLTFKSGLPAHMDATTSGIQILAAITKDYRSAEIANLLPTDKRTDSYSQVVEEVVKKISDEPYDAAAGKEALGKYKNYKKRLKAIATKAKKVSSESKKGENVEKIADLWEQHKALSEEFQDWKSQGGNKDIAARAFWFQEAVRQKFRKVFKGPVMTKYYSSGPMGMAQSLVASFGNTPGFEGIDRSLAYWLTKRISEGADGVFKGPGLVLEQLQLVAKEIASAGQLIQYNNPVTNFPVVNDPRVEKPGTIQLKYNGNNEYIKKRNTTGIIKSKIAYNSEEKNVRKQQTQIAPLVVHSLDASIVHYMFQHANFPVQTIHDSFASNPANAQNLYELVRKGFYEITKGDVLLKIIEQMYENAGFADWKARAKEKYDATQVGDLKTVEGVLDNQFAFSAGVTDPDISKRIQEEARLKNMNQHELADTFSEEQTNEAVNLENKKIAEESKPC